LGDIPDFEINAQEATEVQNIKVQVTESLNEILNDVEKVGAKPGRADEVPILRHVSELIGANKRNVRRGFGNYRHRSGRRYG
jgi:hypothetical protein